MASVNKCILIGNVGKDPEPRYTQEGTCIVTLSIATSRRYKGRDGQPVEETEWHKVVLWGRLAELARDYLKKGRSVYIEGRLRTRSFEDQTGTKKYVTEVVGEVMQFLGGGREDGGQQQQRAAAPAPAQSHYAGNPPPARPAAPRPSAPPARTAPPTDQSFDDLAEDVPF